MADKRIQDLTAATSVGLTDNLVLEQSGQAKKVSGSVLINDLATALDGHGGINDISYTAPTGTSLNGTVTITLADETVETFTVTNGKGITTIAKVSTSGLEDTYLITYNNGTTSLFTVTNGADGSDGVDGADGRGISSITWVDSGTAGDGQTHTGTIHYTDNTTSTVTVQDGYKGDTGAQTYVWLKWASAYPTSDGDMSNSPGPYIGIYSGTASTAPTTYTSYSWYQYKGDTGDAGATGDYIEPVISYGTSTSYSSEPSTWYNDPSSISYAAGNYIWKKTEYTLHAAQSVQQTVKEIIGYIGQNGSGSGTVTQITFNGSTFYDDGTGDVSMTVDAEDVGAIADPATKSNGQVLTYDGTAGEWVASTPTTGSVSTVNNVGPTSGTTNIALYATAIPMSSSDNTMVSAAIPAPMTSGTPADLGTAARGTATTYARSDHVHKMPTASDVGALPSSTNIPAASSTTPSADTTNGEVGTGTTWARADHMHPINVATSGTPSALGTAARGTSSKYARHDHVHAMPSASDVGAVSTADVKMKIYSSVTDIGLVAGSATISSIWSALPAWSILYTTHSGLASGQAPTTYGLLEVIKITAGTGVVRWTAAGEDGIYEQAVITSAPSGTWTPTTTVVKSTAPTISNGTYDSSYSSDIQVHGKIATLSAQITGVSVTTSAAQFGTVPSGYRPAAAVHTVGICGNANPVRIYIGTNGVMNIAGASALTNQTLRFSATWII